MKKLTKAGLSAGLSLSLLLVACGSEEATTSSTDTTGTTVAQETTAAPSGDIPLNADGTVDSQAFLDKARAAVKTIRTSKNEAWFDLDPDTGEPVGEPISQSFFQHEPERRSYTISWMFNGIPSETYTHGDRIWTREEGADWVEETSEEYKAALEQGGHHFDNSEEEPSVFEVEALDLDNRLFRITTGFDEGGQNLTSTADYRIDEEFRITEIRFDGEMLRGVTRISGFNEDLPWPTDLPS